MSATVVIFASAFAGIRYMLNDMAVMPFTALRLTIAVVALVALGAAVGVKRPERSDLGRIVLAGLCGFSGYHVALNFGAALVTAGQAALLVATIPLWTAFGAWKALGEQVAPRHWVGLCVSLAGVAVMSLEPGDLAVPLGSLFVLIAAMCAGANIVMQKALVRRYRAFDLTVMSATVGSLPLILWLPTQGDALAQLDGVHWVVVVYLGLGPITFGYWLSTVALSALPAYRMSQFLLLIPPVASFIAWVALDEVPSGRMIVGGLVVLLGVGVTIRRRKVTRPQPILPGL